MTVHEMTGVERLFDPARLARAVSVLERGVLEGAFPGAQAEIVTKDGPAARFEIGTQTYEAESSVVDAATIYDLASLTKVVACLPSILLLLEQGRLSLDEPIRTWFPDFGGRAPAGTPPVTVRHLLTHTSGLPAWLPLYADCGSTAEAVARICATPLEASPGARVTYSDLGFILLGALIEHVAGQPIDRFASANVFVPLGMTDTTYRPPAKWLDRIAPTERGESFEKRTARAAGGRHPDSRQGGETRGVVHDGNAYYALNGVSGHAGLFATASDVGRYAAAWLKPYRDHDPVLLSPATIALATSDQTSAHNLGRGLGWVVADADPIGRARSWVSGGGAPEALADGPFAGGELLGPRGFGHTGFTGTSLWIDSSHTVAIVLLTNRVHPDAANRAIVRTRALFHNAVLAALRARP